MTAPATIVVDTGGPRGAGGRGGRARTSYGFDTEFHTERTYVPDLALIQIAWADKVALVDPLAVDPAPAGRASSAGPGVAVAHAASQDLDVLMAACGAVPATVFDTQIVAGFLGMSTPSLSRLVDQMLGVSLPKADRLSDWLVRPISDRQITYAAQRRRPPARAARRAHRAAPGTGPPGVGPRASATRCWATAPPARVPEEAWWKLGDIRGMSRRSRAVAQEVAAWRERTAAETNRPRRMVLSDLGLLAISQRPPRNADELRGTRGVDGRHLAQGRAAEILRAVAARPRPPPGPDPDALGGAGRARLPRLPSPCARAWCARSPTTSTSTRACWPRGPTSRNCSAASRAGSIRVGAAPSWGTRCAG